MGGESIFYDNNVRKNSTEYLYKYLILTQLGELLIRFYF